MCGFTRAYQIVYNATIWMWRGGCFSYAAIARRHVESDDVKLFDDLIIA